MKVLLPLWLAACAVELLGCNRLPTPPVVESYAVGTWLGGGSYLFGRDPCTYSAPPSVTEVHPSGMAYVIGPGVLQQTCPGGRSISIPTELPTGAVIAGPTTLTVEGIQNEPFQAAFLSGGRQLRGQGSAVWSLGDDCTGVAAFAPVMGASDTGGPDRFRRLVPSKPGVCTIRLTLGSEPGGPVSWKPLSFSATHRVTIK